MSTLPSGEAICPWAFLATPIQPSTTLQMAPKARTFASILSDSVESSINLSQLPAPVVRGDKTYVKLSEAIYQDQLQSFRTNLIGRLLLKKGSMPMKTETLKSSLGMLWRPTAPWRLVPLGKGYYDIHFNTEDDMRRVWGGGTCTLSNGLFRLSQWKPDFKPGETLPQTHAQVWIKIFGLSQEYWHPRHLMEIARGVGTPLQLDKATKERLYGYYARVLVDVDLAGDLPSSIMVERESHGFSVDIVYENLPPKCNHCGIIGHLVSNCRNLTKDDKRGRSPSRKSRPKSRSRVRQEYRPVNRSLALSPATIVEQAIDAAVNSELENIANKVVSTDLPIHGDQVVLNSQENHDGVATIVRDGEHALVTGLTKQGSHHKATDSHYKATSNNLDSSVDVENPISNDVEALGPPPGFEKTQHSTELVAPSVVDVVIRTSHALNEMQHVTSWFDIVESELPNDAEGETTPSHDVDDNGMMLVLSKSQKKRLRKKIRDTDLRPEPVGTRARVASQRLSQ